VEAPAPLARHDDTDAGAQAHVTIVEDYLFEYRRPFFELLEATLAARSIRLSVAVGRVPDSFVPRGDDVPPLPFVHEVPTRAFSFAGRRLAYKRLSELAAGSDLVVVDQALRHLENYSLLFRRRRRPKIALWGHGARRVKAATAFERFLERRMTTSADWFFAYTPNGAAQVAASGFDPERITVVRNTLDVADLAELRRAVSEDERARLRAALDLPARNVGLFIGALDPSKRLPFLLEAGSIVARRIPDFVLVVVGDGDDRPLVEEAQRARSWLRYVGRATGVDKARLGSVSDVLLMPGRVGLVAVDSFALRTPIVTTTWPYHAPEVDYLEDGVNARFSGDSVTEYAQAVAEVLTERDALSRLKDACAAAVPDYSLDGMVERFAEGVAAALATPRA
jgi:glycosyltransferase involved in cell wall biosynthesis